MGEQAIYDSDGVLRILNLPGGWQVQENSGNRALGGASGSFVIAGSGEMGMAVWGYRLHSRKGMLALATHCRIYLDDLAATPTPNVALTIWMERPCTGAVETFPLGRFDLIAEGNMRPANSCDCSVLMRSELRRS
jgi:hypothetical protein